MSRKFWNSKIGLSYYRIIEANFEFSETVTPDLRGYRGPTLENRRFFVKLNEGYEKTRFLVGDRSKCFEMVTLGSPWVEYPSSQNRGFWININGRVRENAIRRDFWKSKMSRKSWNSKIGLSWYFRSKFSETVAPESPVVSRGLGTRPSKTEAFGWDTAGPSPQDTIVFFISSSEFF